MKLIRALLDRLSDSLFVSVPEKLGLATELSNIPPLRLVSTKSVLAAPVDAAARRPTSHDRPRRNAPDETAGCGSARAAPPA